MKNLKVSFPEDFLVPGVTLDDAARVKLWSARFLVRQLEALWRIGVPVQFPHRLVLVSLIDAILGEIVSAKDALSKKVGDETRSKGLVPWKHEILKPMNDATSDDKWLARILKLRNSGLHGSYLPDQIRITVPEVTDIRLVGYENGVAENAILPKDLEAACQKMQELIEATERIIELSVRKKNIKSDSSDISDWFSNIPTQ